jgi:hypothetical protein
MHKSLTARVRQHPGTPPTKITDLMDALSAIGIDLGLFFRAQEGSDIRIVELAKVLAQFDLDVLAMPAEGTGARVRTAPEREQWPPQRRRFHLHTSPVAPEQVTA